MVRIRGGKIERKGKRRKEMERKREEGYRWKAYSMTMVTNEEVKRMDSKAMHGWLKKRWRKGGGVKNNK